MPIDPSRQSLRLALGASSAFGIGQLTGWRMAFVVPILAVSLPAYLVDGHNLVAYRSLR